MDYYYCPYCGQRQGEIDYGQMITCDGCHQIMTPTKSKYNIEYYYNKSSEKYHTIGHYERILFEEEIKTNPLFDEECYKRNRRRIDEAHKDTLSKMVEAKNSQSNIPKCPTCGSTNVEKISDLKRGVHAVAFGIFSKTAFSQYKCKNCGYKW